LDSTLIYYLKCYHLQFEILSVFTLITKGVVINVQVYNEQIRDLLMPGAPLALRDDACGDVVSTGLSLHKVYLNINTGSTFYVNLLNNLVVL